MKDKTSEINRILNPRNELTASLQNQQSIRIEDNSINHLDVSYLNLTQSFQALISLK